MKCTECPYYYRDREDRYPHCQFGEPSWLDIPPCEQEDIDRAQELDDLEREDVEKWAREDYIAEVAAIAQWHYRIPRDLAREYAEEAIDNDITVEDMLRSIGEELRPERIG